MSKNTLTYQEKIDITTKYLNGESFANLGREYDVPTAVIKKVIDNPEARLQIEKQNFVLSRAKESKKIDELKDEIITFISTAVQEAKDEEKKIAFFDKIKGVLDSIDRISRLNRGEITDNTAHTEKQVKVDVSEIIKALDSPEKKKEFLRSQLVINEEE